MERYARGPRGRRVAVRCRCEVAFPFCTCCLQSERVSNRGNGKYTGKAPSPDVRPVALAQNGALGASAVNFHLSVEGRTFGSIKKDVKRKSSPAS